MGAAQVGGLATLLDIDFENAAGFMGEPAKLTEALYIVYFLSHSMLFCTGALIEPHVILTTAECVFSEKHKFEVIGGAHKFLEGAGTRRIVSNVCVHRGFNHTFRWIKKEGCSPDNLAALVLSEQFSFRRQEHGSEYVINRVRYGMPFHDTDVNDTTCKLFGWGSRRNGYLIPLLIDLHGWELQVLPKHKCDQMWNYKDKYLCVRQPACEDDVGSVIVCSGYIRGIMVSRLVDRPCGVGFLDLNLYGKFLTCAVDDSRDVIDGDVYMEYEHSTSKPNTPKVIHVNSMESDETTPEKEKQQSQEQTEITTEASKRQRKKKFNKL